MLILLELIFCGSAQQVKKVPTRSAVWIGRLALQFFKWASGYALVFTRDVIRWSDAVEDSFNSEV